MKSSLDSSVFNICGYIYIYRICSVRKQLVSVVFPAFQRQPVSVELLGRPHRRGTKSKLLFSSLFYCSLPVLIHHIRTSVYQVHFQFYTTCCILAETCNLT